MNNFQHSGLGGEFDPVRALRDANPELAGAVDVVGRRLVTLDRALENIYRVTGYAPEAQAPAYPSPEQYSGYLVNGEPQRIDQPAPVEQGNNVVHVDFQNRQRVDDLQRKADQLATPGRPEPEIPSPDPGAQYYENLNSTIEERYGRAA